MSPDRIAATRYVALDAVVGLTLVGGAYVIFALLTPPLFGQRPPTLTSPQRILLGLLFLAGTAVLIAIRRFRRRTGSDAAAFLHVRRALSQGEPLTERQRELAAALRFASTRPTPLSGRRQAWLLAIPLTLLILATVLDHLTHRDPTVLLHLAGLILIPPLSGLVLSRCRRRLVADLDRAGIDTD